MMEKDNKASKIAFVTGASSGMGEEISRQLVASGWIVIGAARRMDKLRELQHQLGEAFHPYACDVTDEVQIKKITDTLVEKRIIPSLFFLNAGDGFVEEKQGLDVDIHRKTFEVNYFGVINLVQAWLPHIVIGNTTFVGTSSIMAIKNTAGGGGYGASKAALLSCFDALNMFYKSKGIRFVSVLPGPISTPMLKVDKPLPFTWSAAKAATHILKQVFKGKDSICFPRFWKILYTFLRFLPNSWGQKIF